MPRVAHSVVWLGSLCLPSYSTLDKLMITCECEKNGGFVLLLFLANKTTQKGCSFLVIPVKILLLTQAEVSAESKLLYPSGSLSHRNFAKLEKVKGIPPAIHCGIFSEKLPWTAGQQGTFPGLRAAVNDSGLDISLGVLLASFFVNPKGCRYMLCNWKFSWIL